MTKDGIGKLQFKVSLLCHTMALYVYCLVFR